MSLRDLAALREIARLCDTAADLVARGEAWYFEDANNVPGLAAESLIIKVGENAARLGDEVTSRYQDVPWSLIKRMRDRLARHDEGTDYGAVWDTLAFDLPVIRAQIAGVLNDID